MKYSNQKSSNNQKYFYANNYSRKPDIYSKDIQISYNTHNYQNENDNTINNNNDIYFFSEENPNKTNIFNNNTTINQNDYVYRTDNKENYFSSRLYNLNRTSNSNNNNEL